MRLPAIRVMFVLGFFTTLALLAFAVHLQLIGGLMPCPLCQLQRFVLVIIGLLCLVAAIHNPVKKGVKRYATFIILFALIGASLAARQVWLQLHPPLENIATCGASFSYLMTTLPILDALWLAMKGTGDCSKIVWHFLGISMPGWTLLAFIFYFLLAISQYWRVRK